MTHNNHHNHQHYEDHDHQLNNNHRYRNNNQHYSNNHNYHTCHTCLLQLRLARLLVPLVVQQQLTAIGSDAYAASSEALRIAEAEIDRLDAHINETVDDVFRRIA